jgi:hypothetical protein
LGRRIGWRFQNNFVFANCNADFVILVCIDSPAVAYFLKNINAQNPKRAGRASFEKIGSPGETNFKPEGLVLAVTTSTTW